MTKLSLSDLKVQSFVTLTEQAMVRARAGEVISEKKHETAWDCDGYTFNSCTPGGCHTDAVCASVALPK